ncbi:MAG: flagellar basal body-associated FliL family protein [Pseudomonadota bacterium]|uniref:flagellar basal body-associated FliL family protein n=1 Tax=Herminiimonas arsenitoxidans TaxID=1809410 RepID=UPI000970CD64|nr:flagellar basal body-associated FliL family protein [Herminiimonas arsenitoxidans]
MVKTKQSGNLLITILGGTLAIGAVVAIGIAIAWFYFKPSAQQLSPIAYSNFGPMVVRSSQLSIKATVALQTHKEDAAWVQRNKAALDVALQAALANVDSQRVRTPEGAAYVQEMLRDVANATLKTRSVQEVLLTDYIVQSN